jgi:hypothetical protein
MGLRITTTNGVTRPDWYIGKGKPMRQSDVFLVREIEIDGLEKDYVMKMFPYQTFIPKRNGIIYLYGDIAKIIVGNLTDKD